MNRSSVHLTGLLLRGHRWGGEFAVGGLVACVVALLVGVSALTLSGRQSADALLGSYSHRVQDTAPLGDELSKTDVTAVASAVDAAGASNVGIQLVSSSLWPDQLPVTYSNGQVQIVAYFEDLRVSADSQLPGTQPVTSGRAPVSAGEVALSESLAERLGHPDRVSLFGGRVTLNVTGTVSPVYGEHSWRIVAAPGTWSTFPADEIREGYPQADGGLSVLWDGDAGLEAVLQAVATTNPATAGVESMLTGYVSRDGVIASATTPAESLPFFVPGALLVAFASLVVVNLQRTRVLSLRRSLEGVGMSRTQVMGPVLAGLGIRLAVAVIGGGAAGMAVAMLGRWTVLPLLADQPLSPLPAVGRILPALLMVALAVGLATAGARFHVPSRRRRSSLAMALRGVAQTIPWAFLRRAAVVVVLGWSLPSLVMATDLDAAARAAVPFTGGIVMLLPDVLRGCVRGLQVGRVTTLSARRMMEADRARYSWAVIALAVTVAVPTVFATLYATSFRLEEERNTPSIPSGQLWIQGAGLGSPELVERAAAVVAEDPGLARPIVLDAVDGAASAANSAGAFGIWGLHDPGDLTRLLGWPPASAVEEALASGALVTWGDAGRGLVTYGADGLEETAVPTAVIALDSDLGLAVDPAILQMVAGAMLSSAALDLGGTVTTGTDVVFTDVTVEQQQQAVDGVTAAGITAKAVAYTTPPMPLTFPGEWIVALAGLIAAMLVLVWAVLSGQARQLRDYAARMLAVGLEPRWSWGVLAVQSALVLLTGLVGGLVAGLLAIGIFARFAVGGALTLTIPWAFIGGAVAGATLAAVVASVLALRRLRPQAG
ncbi:ABC transporter permease [Tessaracoccus palaemonis]|uniref:ABC transporter permease n=1 Tax=Tessaracoccus palaemonis TaxID=2829499 RepID=A0ABX8SP70_9ACTN|nr:ABC transporter permease [Tessaracoccus palaemonis]QXT63014.1 ABC transporter permease [Tessaracoccus palaemonis]